MPTTDRSFSYPRAAAVLVPLLLALGGCVAAPLLELAATPTSQAAPCAAGVATPGCNTGATGSMVPGMASAMQILTPATSPSH